MSQFMTCPSYSVLHPRMYDDLDAARRAVMVTAVLRDYYGLRRLREMNVLDVGCSAGLVTRRLAEYVHSCIGVDPDEVAIRFAHEKRALVRCEFRVGNAASLPFDDASFDLVVCNHVLEHVSDLSTAGAILSEIYRVLRRGGACYLAVTHPPVSRPRAVGAFYLHYIWGGYPRYETHHSLGGLRRLTARFRICDYSLHIVRHPEGFGATSRLLCHPTTRRLALLSMRALPWLCPTRVWMLAKE